MARMKFDLDKGLGQAFPREEEPHQGYQSAVQGVPRFQVSPQASVQEEQEEESQLQGRTTLRIAFSTLQI